MRIVHMSALAALVASIGVAQGADTLKIAVGGRRAEYSVSIPQDPSPTEAHAAEELRDYVRRMTGVELEVKRGSAPSGAKCVRIETVPGFGESEYRIKADGGSLLVGGGKRGVLFAVYDLLERFGGVGWYSSWRTVVPERRSFEIPADIDDTEKPAFELREDYWYDAFDGDYAAHNRLDGDIMRFEERHGGRSSMRFGGGLGNAHTFHILVPADEFFDDHPEYFSLVDGKRLRERTQLCLTNPDVLRIVTERVKERVLRDPGARYFGVSQDDNSNYCRCESCAAVDAEEGSHSGSLVRFVNAVAAEVAKVRPDAIVETLAYMYSRKPPAKTRIAPNVMVCLCASGVEYSRPIASAEGGGAASFRDDVRGWGAQTDRLYVWDYVTNFRHYMMPFPNVYVLRDNFRFFRDNHVVSMFSEGAYMGSHGEFAELKAWLSAKWMWNPDLEADPLIDRFMEGFYGEAAPVVRKYFDELEALPKRSLGIAQEVHESWLPDGFIERADAMWRGAEALVANDPECAYNVRMGRLPVVYVRFSRKLRRAEKSVWLCRSPAEYVRKAEAKEDLRWINERMKEAKKKLCFSEYEPHDKLIRRWRKFIKTPLPESGEESAVFGPDKMKFSRPEEHRGEIAEAEGALGGKAYRIANDHAAWCVTKGFDSIAFDPSPDYVFRFRVKVDKSKGAKKHGDLQAFSAGVYDENIRKNTGLSRKVREVKDGWQWYEIRLERPLPEGGAYFWFAPGDCDRTLLPGGANPAFDNIWFDSLEIRRTTGGKQ